MLIEVQVQAYVLAAVSLGKGDIDVALDIIEGFAGYEADRPVLSRTLRDVATLAREHLERERGTAAAAGGRG